MRKFAGLLVLVLGVGAAAVAVADEDHAGGTAKTGVSTPGQTNQINKQIGFIDLYLTNAMNDAKMLSVLSEGEAAAADKALIAEAQKDLNNAIDEGLTHVQKLRTFKSQLGSMASGMASPSGSSDKTGASGSSTLEKTVSPGMASPTASGATAAAGPSDKLAKLDEMERQFKEAKSAAAMLGKVKAADLSSSIDGVSTHLMGADSIFRDIAKWTNYTRLANTSLGTVPVRGTESGAGTSRDLDQNKPPSATPPGSISPSHDMNTPGAMPPSSTTPGASGSTTPNPTTPRKNEPVQPAPGGPPRQ